jgi:hypothetical protein
VWDAASAHLATTVENHAARLQVHLLVIPAGLTYLLQPLDTHVFALLKRRLSALQQERRALHEDGLMTATTWIETLANAVEQVLVNRSWDHAFPANGLLTDYVALRPRVSEAAGILFPLPPRAPLEEETDGIWGRPRPGLHDRILGTSVRHIRRRLAVADAAGVVAGAPL